MAFESLLALLGTQAVRGKPSAERVTPESPRREDKGRHFQRELARFLPSGVPVQHRSTSRLIDTMA